MYLERQTEEATEGGSDRGRGRKREKETEREREGEREFKVMPYDGIRPMYSLKNKYPKKITKIVHKNAVEYVSFFKNDFDAYFFQHLMILSDEQLFMLHFLIFLKLFSTFGMRIIAFLLHFGVWGNCAVFTVLA